MDLCDSNFILGNKFLKQDENKSYIQYIDCAHVEDIENKIPTFRQAYNIIINNFYLFPL